MDQLPPDSHWATPLQSCITAAMAAGGVKPVETSMKPKMAIRKVTRAEVFVVVTTGALELASRGAVCLPVGRSMIFLQFGRRNGWSELRCLAMDHSNGRSVSVESRGGGQKRS